MSIEPLETAAEVVESDQETSPIGEIEELQGLIAQGRERGYLTFD